MILEIIIAGVLFTGVSAAVSRWRKRPQIDPQDIEVPLATFDSKGLV